MFNKLLSRFKKKDKESPINLDHHDISNIDYIISSIKESNTARWYRGVLNNQEYHHSYDNLDDVVEDLLSTILSKNSDVDSLLTMFPILTYDIFIGYITKVLFDLAKLPENDKVKEDIANMNLCKRKFDSIMDYNMNRIEKYADDTEEEIRILETTEEEFDPQVDNSDPEVNDFNNNDIIDVSANNLAIEVIEEE